MSAQLHPASENSQGESCSPQKPPHRRALRVIFLETHKKTRLLELEEAIQDVGFEELLDASQSRSWRCRRGAAEAMAFVEGSLQQQVLERLFAMLEDEHWRVRRAVIETLGKLDSDRSLPHLFEQQQREGQSSALKRSLSLAIARLGGQRDHLASQLLGLKVTGLKQEQVRKQIYANILEIWGRSPRDFEDLPALLQEMGLRLSVWRVSEVQRLSLGCSPPPLSKAPRLLGHLMKYNELGLVSSSHVAHLLVVRFCRAEDRDVALFELLSFCHNKPTQRRFCHQQLEPWREQIAPLLLGWIQADQDFQEIALYWLSRLGAPAKDLFPPLLEFYNRCTKEQKGAARDAIHRALGEMELSEGELFSSLRGILSEGNTDRDTWRLVGILLDHWAERGDIELAVDYIDQHLSEEGREGLAQPREWMASLLSDEPMPMLRLVRKLQIAPIFSRDDCDRGLTGEVLRKILECPYLSKLRQLDLMNLQALRACIPALEGIEAPKEISHLFISSTGLDCRDTAALLDHLALPKLTHLYMGNNALEGADFGQIAEHPSLAGIKHLQLKSSLNDVSGLLLARSPHLGSLDKLNIGRNRLSASTIEVLLEQGSLPKGALVDARHNDLHSLDERHRLLGLAVEKEIALVL